MTLFRSLTKHFTANGDILTLVFFVFFLPHGLVDPMTLSISFCPLEGALHLVKKKIGLSVYSLPRDRFSLHLDVRWP